MKPIQKIIPNLVASLSTAMTERSTIPTIMPESPKSSRPSFDQFNDFNEPLLKSAKVLCQKIALDLKASPLSGGYLLSLCGKSGVGKTMLSKCVLEALGRDKWGNLGEVKELVHAGKLWRANARFFDMRKVSDGFKRGDWDLVEQMEEPTLLILDDIGADYDPNKITASKIDRVLRSRIGKWTIATFNLGLREVADKLDSRIASFILRDNNKFIEIAANDYAMRKK